MLASSLSSAGALVELQAPCLSDSVLELVLDYIYTGALPYTHIQQEYSNLLAVACYLKMDQLQMTLRTEVNSADGMNASSDVENQSYRDATDAECMQLPDSCNVNSLGRGRRYWEEQNPCRTSNKNNVSTSCIVHESTHGVNTDSCMQVPYSSGQELKQAISCTGEVCSVSRVDEEVQEHHFESARPELCQKSTEMLVRMVEKRSLDLLDTSEAQEEETSTAKVTQRLCLTVTVEPEEKRTIRKEDEIHHSPLGEHNDCPLQISFSSSPSSPHPSCGAVPVIRHSRTASVEEMLVQPPYHSVPEPTINSVRAAESGNTTNGRVVEGITAKQKNPYGAQNQDCRDNIDLSGTQSWDYNISHQRAGQDLCYKSTADQYQYSADPDEPVVNRLSHTTDDNGHHVYCDSFQNHAKPSGDDLMSVDKGCGGFNRGRKLKTDFGFDDFPSKHKQLNCSDCTNSSLTNTTEERASPSEDPGSATVSLLLQAPEVGSVPNYDGLCNKREVKEEPYFSSGCPSKVGSRANSYRPHSDWYPNMHGAEKIPKDPAFNKHLPPVSTQPAELLVSYRSDKHHGGVALVQKDISEDRLGSNERQQDVAESAVEAVKKTIKGGTEFGGDGLDEAEIKATTVDIKSTGKELSRPGVEANHKGGGVECETQTTTLTVSTPPCVPRSIQASISSTLSACEPSTLSANMPTNLSPHLATPVHHPFQCTLCKRSFSQRGSLNRHVRSHLGIRPFPCPRCPMTFSRQYRVSEHMRVHKRCGFGDDFQKPPHSSI